MPRWWKSTSENVTNERPTTAFRAKVRLETAVTQVSVGTARLGLATVCLAENVLKIDPTSLRAFVNTSALRGGAPLAHADSPGSQAGSSSQVALSSTSRQLLAALQESQNDIDLERVAALRKAIASGELPFNPDRIADGLLASVRDLIN